jgi:hypothetical protein
MPELAGIPHLNHMTMKKGFLFASLLALAPAAPLLAQAQAALAKEKTMKAMGDDHMMSGWKELDAFHTVMAATWHPVAKSKDLTVIREKAGALADAAQAWSTSKVPKACETKEIQDAIAAVVAQSKSVAQLVEKKASDADVTVALRDVHTKFEVVEKGCHLGHTM